MNTENSAIMNPLEVRDVRKTEKNELVIKEISGQIDTKNINTIVSFGKETVDEISKLSDTILRNTEVDKVNDTGHMLTALGNIMDKFDIKELEPQESKGLISKIFNSAQKQLDKILNKYNSMGSEIDKIYIQLKEYEKEIYDSNTQLEKLFNSNVGYYEALDNYIYAGEEIGKQMLKEKQRLENELDETGNKSLIFEIQNIEQGITILEQRVQDLRMANNVAMQSIPMIKAMQFSNMNLVRKINSAFIITLPVFKQSLAQAVQLRRQKIQADSLSALDARTNEMLIKNAKNTVEQTKEIIKLSSNSSIKMETLEETWNTIVQGVDETRKMQEEASIKREEDRLKLEAIKNEFNQRMLK